MSALGKEAKMGILPRKVLQSDKSTLDRPKLLKIIGIENCGRHEGKIFAIFECRLPPAIFDCCEQLRLLSFAPE
jgi:hypothetical protein